MSRDYRNIQISTGHKPTKLFPLSELSERQISRYGLEYINYEDKDTPSLFRYKRWVYDVGQFICVRGLPDDHPFVIGRWAGHMHDSAYGGVLIRYPIQDGAVDHDCVIVGTFYWRG